MNIFNFKRQYRVIYLFLLLAIPLLIMCIKIILKNENLLMIPVVLFLIYTIIEGGLHTMYDYEISEDILKISFFKKNLVTIDINDVKIFDFKTRNNANYHYFLLIGNKKYQITTNKEKYLEFKDFTERNNIDILPENLWKKFKPKWYSQQNRLNILLWVCICCILVFSMFSG